jgi:hypothetical protein
MLVMGWWHSKKACSNHTMTPHQLYEWAQSSIRTLNFDSVTKNEYKEEEGLLSSRFATAETLHGTQQLHACMLVTKGILT